MVSITMLMDCCRVGHRSLFETQSNPKFYTRTFLSDPTKPSYRRQSAIKKQFNQNVGQCPTWWPPCRI